MRIESIVLKHQSDSPLLGFKICDSCANYVYDEDWECYTCMVNMDEDDYYRLMSGNSKECPYYQDNDEYKVVRHQI